MHLKGKIIFEKQIQILNVSIKEFDKKIEESKKIKETNILDTNEMNVQDKDTIKVQVENTIKDQDESSLRLLDESLKKDLNKVPGISDNFWSLAQFHIFADIHYKT